MKFNLNSSMPFCINEQLENFQLFFTSQVEKGFALNFEESFRAWSINQSEYSREEIQELKKKSFQWFHDTINFTYIESFISSHLEELYFIDSKIWIKEHKGKRSIDLPIPEKDFKLACQYLSLSHYQNWNSSKVFASFKVNLCKHHFRASLLHATSGSNQCPRLFLRHVQQKIFSLEEFTSDHLETISSLIVHKKNIIIAGPTGSGKTSLLNACLKYISPTEHLILLEDTEEILTSHPFQTHFLSQENKQEKSLQAYCAYSLRMSPDRLILGEMRSKEVIPFLLAMNTGHRGLMSTIHANSARETLQRLALLFCLYSENQELSFDRVMKIIAQGVDYVIYLENKKVQEIIKILGSEKGQCFFERIPLSQ